MPPREVGGGGGTASLKVGTHCETTAPAFCGLSALQISLTAFIL